MSYSFNVTTDPGDDVEAIIEDAADAYREQNHPNEDVSGALATGCGAAIAIVKSGADRIRATNIFAAPFGAQGQMLAGLEPVSVAQVQRHGERNRNSVGRLAANVSNLQSMEFNRHVRFRCI